MIVTLQEVTVTNMNFFTKKLANEHQIYAELIHIERAKKVEKKNTETQRKLSESK